MRGRPRISEDDFVYTNRMSWYRSRGWNTNREMAVGMAKGKCQRCGKDSKRLEAHHIADPFPTRNIELLLRLDNVEVICPACHRFDHHNSGTYTICETCGTKVNHNPAQKQRRFCSIQCRDKHPDFVRMSDRTCPICNLKFTPTRQIQKCCGATCGAKLSAKTRLKNKSNL